MRSRVVAQQRFSDPILDEKIPDPIYDEETGYLGKSPIGFVQDAESFNGRAAMAGFTICFLQEIVLGKGVLELYGLPYDVGAVPTHLWEPTLITGGVASVLTIALTAGLWFGGVKFWEKEKK